MNLRTKNLIVDKVNGQPVLGGYDYIEPTSAGYSSKNPSTEGWYELSNGSFVASSDTEVDDSKAYYAVGTQTPVYDQNYIDGLEDNLNARIDSQIETFTVSAVPTLLNEPASGWQQADYADHVGDLCYVLNAASQADGYCYRFAYDSSTQTYGWVLIKDNDVTAALQDIIDIKGWIGDGDVIESHTDVASWITNTDSELSSTKSSVSSLETAMGTKVDTSTFNTLSQTVGQNTSSITSLTTKVDGIQVGGRNLVWDTAWLNVSDKWSNWGAPTTREIVEINGVRYLHLVTSNGTFQGYSQNWTNRNGVGEISAGDKIVVSFKAYGAVAGNTACVGVHWCDSSGTILDQTWTTKTLTTSPVVYKSGSFTMPANASCFNVMVGRDTAAVQEVWIGQVKIEKGTLATNWTPAPEDLATTASVTTISQNVSTIDQKADGISTKVSNLTTTLGTNADGTTKAGDVMHRVSSAETNITQNADAIALRATKSEVLGDLSLYTPLEYLQSSGTQRIDTGYKRNGYPFRIDADVEWVSVPTGQVLWAGDYNGNGFAFGKKENTTAVSVWGNSDGWWTFGAIAANTKYSYSLGFPSVTARRGVVNGAEYNTYEANNSGMPNPGGLNVGLFSGKGTEQYVAASVKIYSAKIFNPNLVRDFVPVKRISDSVLGMYDRVNGVFYPNAGTGTFTAGPETSWTQKSVSASSDISVQAGLISSRVERNGVVSSINQSPESVTISASKVDIAGTITAINNNTTTTINGGKITSNTITADKINASDINASHSLTVGALTTTDQENILNSNVRIGGKNLLLRSEASVDNVSLIGSTLTYVTEDGYSCYKITGASTNGSMYASNNKDSLTFHLLANTQYTYSAWIKLTTTGSATSAVLNFNSLGHFSVKNANSTASDKTHEDVSNKRIYSPNTVSVNTWTKIQITFTTNSLAGSTFGVYPKYNLGSDYTLFIREMKLELGNKATDWTPAPEDIDAGVIIGGQNLAKNTHIFTGNGRVVPTTPQAYQANISNGRGLTLCHTSDILANLVPSSPGVGEEIVVSFDFKLNTNGVASHVIHFYPYQGNGISIEGDFSLTADEKTSSWVRVSRVTRAKNFGDNGSYTIGCIYFYDSTGNNYFSIRNVKIERGNRATDWTPAPEDTDLAISNAAKTATTYITHVDNNGIFVSPSSQSPTANAPGNSVRIDANGMDVFKGGTSVAFYGDSSRIGRESARNVYITGNEIQMRSGTTAKGAFNLTNSNVPQLWLDNSQIRIIGSHGNVSDGVNIDKLVLYAQGVNNSRHAEVEMRSWGVGGLSVVDCYDGHVLISSSNADVSDNASINVVGSTKEVLVTGTLRQNNTAVSLEGHTHTELTPLGTVSGTTHAAALKTYFDNNKANIPREKLINFLSTVSDNGAQAMGYFIKGYDSSPYGGFFVAHYNTPYYVGISGGTYTQWVLSKDGHTHSYLPLSGGTLTGAMTWANNTWNTMGDDAYIGDQNQAGMICIKGKNGATGIYFAPYSGSTAQTIKTDGAGTMTISGTVNVGTTIKQNGTAVSLDGHTHAYLPTSALTIGTSQFDTVASTAAGWKRVGTFGGYANGIVIVSGSYNYGAPTTAVLAVSTMHGVCRIRQICCSNVNRYSQARLVGSSGTWYLELYQTNAQSSSGPAGETTVRFFGTGNFSAVSELTPGSGTTVASCAFKVTPTTYYGADATNPDVLSTTATNGTVSLSASAANYTHMRIYFNISGSNLGTDNYGMGSVDVYAPNGKYVVLSITRRTEDSTWTNQLVRATVLVSGTTITKRNYGYVNFSTTSADSNITSNTLYIYRVEAWNE